MARRSQWLTGMFTPSRFALPLVLLVTSLAAVGCAAQPSEEAGGSADEVKLDDALPTGAVPLTKDVPASEATRKEVGATSWSVFFANDRAKDIHGVIAYGLDADGDVSVVVTLGTSRDLAEGKVAASVVRFDDNGVAADQRLGDAARAALDADVRRIARGLVAAARRAEGAATDADERVASDEAAERYAKELRRRYPRSGVDCSLNLVLALAGGLQVGLLGVVAVASAPVAATLGILTTLFGATIAQAQRRDAETYLQSVGRLASDTGEVVRNVMFDAPTLSCGLRR